MRWRLGAAEEGGGGGGRFEATATRPEAESDATRGAGRHRASALRHLGERSTAVKRVQRDGPHSRETQPGESARRFSPPHPHTASPLADARAPFLWLPDLSLA